MSAKLIIDLELIELANAALSGAIADTARSASILQRAGIHLSKASRVCNEVFGRFIEETIRAAEPEAWDDIQNGA
ncbi:MAG TPA: hypothetical protein VGP76_03410 [Planctomycetaceae bacterium]|jgi:hypothetical protein|nr:hypothetical protein [Planctomycetaceae bacterium]